MVHHGVPHRLGAAWLVSLVSLALACTSEPPTAKEPAKSTLAYDGLLAWPGERAVLQKRTGDGTVHSVGIDADGGLLWTHESEAELDRFDQRWLHGDDHLVEASTGRVVQLPPHSGRLVVVDGVVYELTETGVVARTLGDDPVTRWRADTGFRPGGLGVVGGLLVVSDHHNGEHSMAAVSLDHGEVRPIERPDWWVGRDDESVFFAGNDELRRVSVPDGALLARLRVPVLVDEANWWQTPLPHPIGAFDGDTLWFVPTEEGGWIVRWSGDGEDARWRVAVPPGVVPRRVHRPNERTWQTASVSQPELPPTTCWAIGREHPSLDGLYRTRLTCVDLRSGEITWTSPTVEGQPLVRHDPAGTLLVLRRFAGDDAVAVRLEREPVRAWDLGDHRADALDGSLWLYDGTISRRTSSRLDEVPEGVRVVAAGDALAQFVVRPDDG